MCLPLGWVVVAFQAEDENANDQRMSCECLISSSVRTRLWHLDPDVGGGKSSLILRTAVTFTHRVQSSAN